MSGTAPEKPNPTPRTREASPPLLLGNQQGTDDQLTEGVSVRGEESDPPIVVRDGRTDHTAKGRAVGQSGHCTHARGTNAPTQSVSSALSALAREAGREKKHRFGSLYRLIDLQMLYESSRGLNRSAAPGVDGITVADYEENLDENLRSYYCVIGNSPAVWRYYSAVKMLIFKWLNRRSQRKSYTWKRFWELFAGGWEIPAPRIVEQGGTAPQQRSLALAKS